MPISIGVTFQQFADQALTREYSEGAIKALQEHWQTWFTLNFNAVNR
jgi:hypothetical protein